MFSQLGDKLQDIFKDLRGHGKITETNINDAMRQVRLALLEADVDFQVAKSFIARVKEKALGEEVLRSVTPGQQIVKIFHDELTALARRRRGAAESRKARAHPDGRPERRGQDDLVRQAGALSEETGPRAAADRLRFAPPGGDRATRHPRPAGRRAGLHARRRRRKTC